MTISPLIEAIPVTGLPQDARTTARLVRVGSVTTDLVHEVVTSRPAPLPPTRPSTAPERSGMAHPSGHA